MRGERVVMCASKLAYEEGGSHTSKAQSRVLDASCMHVLDSRCTYDSAMLNNCFTSKMQVAVDGKSGTLF